MKKGGYQILDFENRNFITTAGLTIPQEIKGIYDKVEGTKKTFLLSGIVVFNSIELNDVFATPRLVGTNYIFDKVYSINSGALGTLDITITISDENIVTVSSAVRA